MEKVKFWKNTSSEFDKIESKDANTIYYLTDTGKIYLGDTMYGGSDMPFTLVSKDDTRFSSITNLFPVKDDTVVPTIDPGMYMLQDDIDFSFDYFFYMNDYMAFSIEEPSEEDIKEAIYTGTCTLPKGTLLWWREDSDYFEIHVGGYTRVYERCTGGGTSDSFSTCFLMLTGLTSEGIGKTDNKSLSILQFDGFNQQLYLSVLTGLFTRLQDPVKKGQTLVVQKDASGSGAFPFVKFDFVGAQATNITDDDYKNYQTMDQWFALDDGMYLANTDKLSITVEGKNKLYSAQAKAFDELVGIGETYNKSLEIPKGNYIAVYTTKAGGTFYNKYKMMIVYQDKADPSSEDSNVPSAGVSVVITLGSASGSSTSFTKDVKVYDFNQASAIQSILNTYMGSVFLPLLGDKSKTGYDVPTEGQIAQWHGDLTNGFKLAGVDKDSISPIKVITESERLNYNTLDLLCHLSDGVYMYTGDTAIELQYKSQDLLKQATGSDGGTQSGDALVFDESIHLENGAVFSVYTGNSSDTNNSEKTIAIMSGVRQNTDANTGYFLINATPDSGSGTEADPYKYGTTGVNCNTSDVGSLGIQGGVLGISLFKGLFGETPPTDGQVAQFKTDSTSPLGVTIQGADVSSSVPITVINAENYENFTTLQGILDHPDGMYLVDDCGVTGGDAQLTIESFNGHCINILLASVEQFQQVVPGPEIMCYKGSTISILTEGDISDGATRYVSICNTPCGVSGEGNPDSPSRMFPDAGTSAIKIEIHAVADRSSGKVVYSYDIDGGTKTLWTYPVYDAMLNMYTTGLVGGGVLTGKSSYTPGQLVGVVGNADSLTGYNFTGVDASEFKSPFTLITNDNADNYNTLDKLCHLDDGLYLCKDTYNTTKKDYIVEVSFKGIDYVETFVGSFGGDTSTISPKSKSIKCKNGAIISVVTSDDYSSNKSKVVRITHGLDGTIDFNHSNYFFNDTYIIASPDDSSASTLVYGVTGTSTYYYQPVSFETISSAAYMSIVLPNASDTDIAGKMAVWEKINDQAALLKLGYADIPSALVGASTAVTPAQVKASVETGQSVSVSFDSGSVKYTFTGFLLKEPVATSSTIDTTVVASVGNYTLTGNVTKGTWTFHDAGAD